VAEDRDFVVRLNQRRLSTGPHTIEVFFQLVGSGAWPTFQEFLVPLEFCTPASNTPTQIASMTADFAL
jgi:hypothetical protein